MYLGYTNAHGTHIRFLHNSPGYLVLNIYSSTYVGLYVVASVHYLYIVCYSKTSLIRVAWDQGVSITWKMMYIVYSHVPNIHKVRPLNFNFLWCTHWLHAEYRVYTGRAPVASMCY